MLLLQVLLATAALLLAVAGVTKLRSPQPAVHAARAMSLPATPAALRVLAAAEVGLGAALVFSDALGVRLAAGVLYAAFLAFVLFAVGRNLPISSCGCFGADDAPPSLAHVAINAAMTAAVFVAAADAIDSPITVATGSWADGAVIALGATTLTALAAWLLSGRLRPSTPRAT